MLNDRAPTSERLYEAGLQRFYDRGYGGTSVRDVTDACGLTPGALYSHFASKDDLLFAICDRVLDEADAALAAALRRAGPGPAAQLEALATDFTAFHLHRPRETRVANREDVHLPEALRASIVARKRRVRALFADVLAEGEETYAFHPVDGAVLEASMAILTLCVQAGEWFDPAGPRSVADTAALHGRLALRIAGAR